ncbi:unnamed protein product [marine sediment metagenome]|uniref:Uncharacterized protein n=1 Tax=marine sediment metagenome TaxID=412755 RepID=X1AAP5_9ZZZZ
MKIKLVLRDWQKKLSRKKQPYKLSDTGLSTIVDSLDETGGYLIKESELRYWIERIVNEDRERR